jgi:ERCC4-type nuclease
LIIVDANESRWDDNKRQYKIKWVRDLVKKDYPFTKADLSRVDNIDRIGPDILILGPKGNLAIERKDCRDFVGSVVKGHMFEQIYYGLCKIEGAKPILLVEGSWNRAFAKREYLRPMAMGAFAKFVATTPLQFIQTDSAAMTADVIRDFDIQANSDKEPVEAPRRVHIPTRRPVGLRDIAFTMMYAFPGIAGPTALGIVKKMPEPKTIANLTQQPLLRLKTIAGPKKGELMFHTFNCPLEKDTKSPIADISLLFEDDELQTTLQP